MIAHPSKEFFRQLVLFGFLVWGAVFIITYTGYDARNQTEAEALSWNYYGAKFSYETLGGINILLSAMYAIGIVGLAMFKGWSRILILVALVCDFVLTSFMGLIVLTGAVDMLSLLAGILIGVPWVLSFFAPCSEYFTDSKKRV